LVICTNDDNFRFVDGTDGFGIFCKCQRKETKMLMNCFIAKDKN